MGIVIGVLSEVYAVSVGPDYGIIIVSSNLISNKMAYANSADPEQTAAEWAVWSGLHCLPFQ